MLSLEEDWEEARLMARRESFAEGPEMMARRRLETRGASTEPGQLQRNTTIGEDLNVIS
jgi:hypothetical protein